MGKALLIIVFGLSALFGTMTLNLSRYSLHSVDNYSHHYKSMAARNAATSGVYMALSKLCDADTFSAGFQELPLANSTFSVDVQDNTDDPMISSMERRIVSAASYEDVSKSIVVRVGIPPKLADLAVFVTDTVIDVRALDESRNEDPSLIVQNAPDMLPFDKESLVALADDQDHVIDGDFSPPNNWPDNDPGNDYYWDSANDIPNVTQVKGNMTIGGGTTVYGIFIVEGNATLDGNARLVGVLYLPNPGTIVIHGGGNPNESTITGGVFANGSMQGTGNHITVEYNSDYMANFGAYQLGQNLFIISWTESPAS